MQQRYDFLDLNLLIPEQGDSERDAVAVAWESGGGKVIRLGRFWEPPSLDSRTVRVYGNDTFCLVLEQKLGLKLISPADDLLINLDRAWTKREIVQKTLSEALQAEFPQFIKPLVPKLFRSSVYQSVADLQRECIGLEETTSLLISKIVQFQAEARCFLKGSEVVTSAVYEGVSHIEKALDFATDFALQNQHLLPRTCVVDLAQLPNGDWAILEANATWGAGLNGCDALSAAKCIACATEIA